MRLFAGRKWLVASLLVIVVIVLLMLKCNVIGSGVRVAISKETTYITEPLRPDGYPDYVAALNERFSRGVTPENNSAVLFWKAVGPRAIPKECRKKYFEMLGIAPLPETGDYFVTSERHLDIQLARHKNQPPPPEKQPELWSREKISKQLGSAFKPLPPKEKLHEQLDQQFELILERPWSKQEFPVWAAWLALNEKPLAVIIEASKRPRKYSPLINTFFGDAESEMALSIWLESNSLSRDVARALVARSMLYLGEGKTEEAWQDLMTCHRLARLVGQGPTLVDALVAITLDGVACRGEHRLLEQGNLAPSQIAAMRKDLAKLSPMPKIADVLDQGERLFYLDGVTLVLREGFSALNAFPNTSFRGPPTLLFSAAERTVDWDVVLRIGNAWFDRQVAASRKPTHKERKKAFDKIEDDLDKSAKAAEDRLSFSLSLLTGPRQAISERVGQMFVGLLLPVVAAAVEAEDRSVMEFQLTELAFALVAYRVDHGSYPAKLADLVPKYITKVPKDIFNDADLHYQRQPNGYLLYSVGPSGIDDGGKGYDDFVDGRQTDDLIIRIPSVKKSQQK